MTKRLPILLFLLSSGLHAADTPWWNKTWTQRQTITIDPSAADSDASGTATVLIRLHDGNFSFANATEGGTDLRFIAADGKTSLSYQVEKWDSLLNEAFVWINLPDLSAKTVHLYYGGDPSTAAPDKSKTFGESSSLVWHFGETTPIDSTPNGNNAAAAVTLAEGSLIGKGLRLPSPAPVTIASSPSLAWTQGQDLTASFWFKPASLQPGAVLFSRGGLKLILDQGVPLIDAGGQRSATGTAVAVGSWHHLALVSQGGKLTLHLDGKEYSSLAATLPASDAPLTIGSADSGEAFIGEFDELQISGKALAPGQIQFAFANQGASEASQRVVALGAVESGEGSGSHSAALEHVMLFGDIARNMMFDGWIAIGVCLIMILVGWTVAIRKFAYLNSIEKGSAEFLRQWKALSSDLTAIDHTDDRSVRSLGGTADESTLQLVQRSPLYEIYHIGSEEIRHRLTRDKDRTKGLSGRSIQAIRASLDAGLVHAQHKLTNGLVYLTISIAGGPYVGLLGTVVGVMITFAIIAKSGEVDVNSIAPGIASALLATVAGLVVAIPALFIYSYLNNRIKNTTAEIQVFIDEFIAKMAEFYPPAGENSPYAPTQRSTDS
jgi:biopolymer transport protein ExbB